MDQITSEIAAEWDQNVSDRALELESGSDKTFLTIICPTIKTFLLEYQVGNRGLDVGCGLGYLTNYINELNFFITGVDISTKSIEYASRRFPHIVFENKDVNDYADSNTHQFDFCIANMVLHNVVNLKKALQSISHLLKEKGVFIVTIPHPCYWLSNKNFKELEPRNVANESIYKINFKIKNGKAHSSFITYVQRNIGQYSDYFINAKFSIIKIHEASPEHHNNPDLLFFVLQKNTLG